MASLLLSSTATPRAKHPSEHLPVIHVLATIDEVSFSFAYEEQTMAGFIYAGEKDLQSMHEFLPFLFIAFSDGQYPIRRRSHSHTTGCSSVYAH
jgi:hypothetical protein